jgi:hypothetical protein
LERLAPLGAWADAPTATRVVLLPSGAEAPRLPPWLLAGADESEGEAGADARLSPWKVTGLALDALAALDLLVALPLRESGERVWGADLRYWGLAAKLGLEFLARHKYLPGMTEDEGEYRAVWLPVLDEPHDRARLRALAAAMPPVCRALFAGTGQKKSELAPAPHALLDRFLKRLIDQAVRDWGRAHLDRRRKQPTGVAGAWWSALWSDGGQIEVPVTQRRDVARLYDAWREWMGQLRAAAEAAFRLCFRLEPPEVDPESGQVTWPDWTFRGGPGTVAGRAGPGRSALPADHGQPAHGTPSDQFTDGGPSLRLPARGGAAAGGERLWRARAALVGKAWRTAGPASQAQGRGQHHRPGHPQHGCAGAVRLGVGPG